MELGENEDRDVDDLIDNLNKKKKIKSGKKGKRGELDIVHLLNERFAEHIAKHPNDGAFSRSVGSGNRFGQQVHLSNQAANVYAGDITCPINFKFVLESKNGYNDIDLCHVFGGKCKELDVFLNQVSGDCERPATKGRLPFLIWKKDRREKVAFLKKELLLDKIQLKDDLNLITYGPWLGVNLTWVLALPDEFFFN